MNDRLLKIEGTYVSKNSFNKECAPKLLLLIEKEDC